MPIVNLGQIPIPILRAGEGPVLFVNNSETSTVYIDWNPGVTSPIPVPPQASVTLDGTRTWYGTTQSSTIVQCLTLPGGVQWNNPVGVSVALDSLGLALNSTVEATNAQLGTGVAPAIPGVASAQSLNEGPTSGATLYTFTGAGRIWAAQISYAIVTNSDYSAGMQSQTYARVFTGSGITLAVCEAGVSGPEDSNSNGSGLVINGVGVAEGDTIQIDVNGGTSITNAVQRASGVVLYSIP